MPKYVIEVSARKACGCTLALDFLPDDPEEKPDEAIVGAVLFCALEDDSTEFLQFLTAQTCRTPHAQEKITVTAQVKVRS